MRFRFILYGSGSNPRICFAETRIQHKIEEIRNKNISLRWKNYQIIVICYFSSTFDWFLWGRSRIRKSKMKRIRIRNAEFSTQYPTFRTLLHTYSPRLFSRMKTQKWFVTGREKPRRAWISKAVRWLWTQGERHKHKCCVT